MAIPNLNYFLTANNSRNIALNIPLIYEEIRKIEEKILYSSREGFFDIVVDDTYMTASSAAPLYYDSWKNNKNDEKTEQMNFIINYFKNNGYMINRITSVSSLSSFKWVLRW